MICKAPKLGGTLWYNDKGSTRRGWLGKMSLLHETICQCSFSFSSTKLYALFGGKVSNYPRVAMIGGLNEIIDVLIKSTTIKFCRHRQRDYFHDRPMTWATP